MWEGVGGGEKQMENNVPKVSVIIPVYNTENYLKKCLDSVCNQTLKDIEIICINDCSPDGCLEILKEYASKDDRFKIIDFKENKGAACARNAGIDAAQGEYLGFVDSDDFIDLDFYEKLYHQAILGCADVVKGSDMKICHINGTVEIDEQNWKIRQSKTNFWCQYTTCIYKKEFIQKNNIKFPEGLLVGEDPVFAIKCAFLSNKIDIVNNAQYYYMRRENSLNSEYWNLEKIKSYMKYIELVTDFVIAQNPEDKIHRRFFGWLLNDIYCTRNAKSQYKKSFYSLFTDFYYKIQHKVIKFPIRILYDAKIFRSSDKRGIYWVAYNILKELKKDKRFEVTLWLERNWSHSALENDSILKDLKCEYSFYRLGSVTNHKLVKNKHFNPLEYDIYFNPAHNAQLTYNVLRPLVFNVLHDVIPLIKGKYMTNEHTERFWKFHNKLDEDNYCFCVSQSCKRGFLRFFDKLDANKMTIAYNSTAQQFFPEKDSNKLQKILNKYKVSENSRGEYIFYFGAANDPRKNLLFNIKCFIKFIEKNNIKDLFFYIGGSGGDELKAKLKSILGSRYNTYEKYIITLGFIDDEDVNTLYSNSLFFSFLSLYEGFGMPPLEAMQAGVPVICANNSSLPEVVGDSALLVDAENEDEVIRAFEKFYYDKNLRDEYIERGFSQARKFSWEKTVNLMKDKMIEVLCGARKIENDTEKNLLCLGSK